MIYMFVNLPGCMIPSKFYGNRPSARPQTWTNYSTREDPRSDSECSDIDGVDDSEDEYLLSQDDEAQFRHDLMLDFEGNILFIFPSL